MNTCQVRAVRRLLGERTHKSPSVSGEPAAASSGVQRSIASIVVALMLWPEARSLSFDSSPSTLTQIAGFTLQRSAA